MNRFARTGVASFVCAAIPVGVPAIAHAAGVVGTGTPESCTAAAFDAALATGGLVTFNCGGPATIDLSASNTRPRIVSSKTTIDGGGLITISGGNGQGYGGALFNAASLTITGTIFAGNHQGGCWECIDGGGAILNFGSLTVTHSTFTGNTALSGGGAIFNFGGSLTVSHSTFTGNAAVSLGGAILNGDGSLTITDSTFGSNTAVSGGSIYSYDASLTIAHSTFTHDFFPLNPDPFGAITSVGTSASIANSTIVGLGVVSEAGRLTVTNTIIASGNCYTEKGTVTDGGHNLIEGSASYCGLVNGVDGNIVGVDPMLDPAGLKDNGGPTQTIALRAGSPAINAGDPEACANPPVNGLDQRGYLRPGTGASACSIGAFEYNSAGPPSISCAGDCTGDGEVTIDELITLVNIALGSAELTTCPAGNWNGDAEITVDEIVLAVNAALGGCGDG